MNIVIADQSSICGAHGCQSLFVNGLHIADSQIGYDIDLETLAENLAAAIGGEVQKVRISEYMLAKYIVYKEKPELREKFDQACQSATVEKQSFAHYIGSYDNEILYEALRYYNSSLPPAPNGILEIGKRIMEDYKETFEKLGD